MTLVSSKVRRGFTLIELLVVIAIIGILSAVVLASLNTARTKGNDASVKSNLDTIRTQSAIFYDTNNGYSTCPSGTCTAVTASATTGSVAACAVVGTMFKDDANIKAAIVAADKAAGGNGTPSVTYCANTVGSSSAGITTWAVATPLSAAASTSWCVDSTGASKQEAVAASSAIVGVTCI